MKLKNLLVLAASVCTIFSMTTVAFAEDAVQEPDGSAANPYVFTDTDEAQPVIIGGGSTVYFSYSNEQMMALNGTTLKIVDPGYDPEFGTPIYVANQMGMGMMSDGDDGKIDGIILYQVNTMMSQGFMIVNQNPRLSVNITMDCVSDESTEPPVELPGTSYDSAVVIEDIIDVKTEVGNADSSATYGNAYFYKYTATETGFHRFWIDEVLGENVEGSLTIENLATWVSAYLADEGVVFEEGGKACAVVYANEGEEISIQVSTLPNADYSYSAADITWSGDVVAGTEEAPITIATPEFSFKVPAGMEVVFEATFDKQMLTLSDGYMAFEFDGEVTVYKNIYVIYNDKKYSVDEEGILELVIAENGKVSFAIGNEVESAGGFTLTISSAPAEDANVVSKEEVAELEATVENAPEDSELVLAPVVWEVFNAIKDKVAEVVTDGVYQIIDITLIDSSTGLPIQPEEGTVVTVTIKAPTALKDAKVVAVYRYDVDTAKLVIVDDEVEVKNGKITFDTDHFSSYVFADVTPADSGDGNGDGNGDGSGDAEPPVDPTPEVKPGDTANVSMLLFVVVLAAAAVVLTKKTVTE